MRLSQRHPSTAARAYRLLSMICNTAIADEVIARSPCKVIGVSEEHAPERLTATLAESCPRPSSGAPIGGAWRCCWRRGASYAAPKYSGFSART